MDNKMWDIIQFSTLEKLVHALHMNDVWAETKPHYDHLKKQDIWMTDQLLCECVNDIDNNGIANFLHFMALKIRYPGLTLEKLLKINDGHHINVPNRLYKVVYRLFVHMFPKLLNFNFTQDIEDNLQHAYRDTVLVDDDKVTKHLDSEDHWQYWKRDMKSFKRQDHYELAMFLYCTLNRDLGHELQNGHFHYEFHKK